MAERNKGIWPFDKATRSCNLGGCPAFKLTPEDMDYQDEATRLIKIEGKTEMEAIEILGLPMGTCLAVGKRVVATLDCSIDNQRFLDYFK